MLRYPSSRRSSEASLTFISDTYLTFLTCHSWITTSRQFMMISQFVIQSGCHWFVLQWPILLCSTADHLLKNKFIDVKDNPGKVVNVTVATGQLFQSTVSLAWLIPRRY